MPSSCQLSAGHHVFVPLAYFVASSMALMLNTRLHHCREKPPTEQAPDVCRRSSAPECLVISSSCRPP